eukprot:7859665-Prorocentrum_lima.AAC.1
MDGAAASLQEFQAWRGRSAEEWVRARPAREWGIVGLDGVTLEPPASARGGAEGADPWAGGRDPWQSNRNEPAAV